MDSRLRATLDQWFSFYNGYDPAFTANVPEPYRALGRRSTNTRFLRDRAGLKPGSAFTLPVAGGRGGRSGRGGAAVAGAAPSTSSSDRPATTTRSSAIRSAVTACSRIWRGEMIPYTPEQLIEIGNREYAWCENEMKKASREMGFGDDWKKALEKVKNPYVPTGQQPELIRDLALEAEAYSRSTTSSRSRRSPRTSGAWG